MYETDGRIMYMFEMLLNLLVVLGIGSSAIYLNDRIYLQSTDIVNATGGDFNQSIKVGIDQLKSIINNI